MKFEWDPEKARLNLRKHKVSFEEAATALKDPMAATGCDPDHSVGEERYVTFGVSKSTRAFVGPIAALDEVSAAIPGDGVTGNNRHHPRREARKALRLHTFL